MKQENRGYSIRKAVVYDSSYFNVPLALFYKDKQIAIINAGSSDYTTIFRDGEDVIVYADNDRLGYMSIDCFNATGLAIGDMFLDSDGYDEFSDLHPINRAKAMLNYIY